MKSKFFKGLAVKSLILASALALVNCDDSSSPNAPSTTDEEIQQPADSSGSTNTGDISNPDDGIDPAVPGSSTSEATDPNAPVSSDANSGISGDTNPANPDDPATNPEDPAVGPATPASSSSDEAPAASSSSEKTESSYSVAPVPET
ncbi:MAG: hypothetical protein HUK20_13660, partial [Fibrobacter sp.]|nr:hypothetical protein [Fibrobacter sp.]